DGATIQRASFQALENGVTLDHCLKVAREVRGQGVQAPLIFMGYFNPFLQYGLKRLTEDCHQAGVDGLIVPDLPAEEASELAGYCHERSMDLISMLAPTSTEERIARVCQIASGFIYCVSLTGVTGARTQLSPEVAPFLARVRRHTSLPLAVGFGISTRRHVEEVARLAEAAVVGSAVIETIDRTPPAERESALAGFARELKGSRGGHKTPG
ncbi:MAG: tryptophan synthase subunit alpha, partial [Dehalococcoidia bacterium]|nr:tryptophan synthase subunit alpha [Dehalococcoidia bacterium]